MATIIVPAHNEAAVIAETLSSLTNQLDVYDRVIVVSNGSTDGTESIARGFGPQVTVLSTPVASKTNAIALAEQYGDSFPRIYLDADVRLSPGSLANIKLALASGRWQAVSPQPIMDSSRSSWLVKAYYRIWLSLPYCQSGMIGAGVYALSEAGRGRFGQFPDLIADDGYVRALFQEHERGKADNAFAIVRAPASLHWLLRVKTRSRLGQMQLAQRFPQLVRNEQKPYGRATVRVLANPLNWSAALVYLYVALVSRAKAKRQLAHVLGYKWEKDDSSRRPIPGRLT